MLSWILIALAIAVIFGVIKIEDIKAQWQKLLPHIKNLLSAVVSWSKHKTDEIKSIADHRGSDNSDTDTK